MEELKQGKQKPLMTLNFGKIFDKWKILWVTAVHEGKNICYSAMVGNVLGR